MAAVQAIVEAIHIGVCIFSILREKCDIKQINRFLDSAQYFVHYNCSWWCICWILQLKVWLCLTFT